MHHVDLTLDQVKDDDTSSWNHVTLQNCDSIFKLKPIAANMYDSICHRCLIYNCIIDEKGKKHTEADSITTLEYFPLSIYLTASQSQSSF